MSFMSADKYWAQYKELIVVVRVVCEAFCFTSAQSVQSIGEELWGKSGSAVESVFARAGPFWWPKRWCCTRRSCLVYKPVCSLVEVTHKPDFRSPSARMSLFETNSRRDVSEGFRRKHFLSVYTTVRPFFVASLVANKRCFAPFTPKHFEIEKLPMFSVEVIGAGSFWPSNWDTTKLQGRIFHPLLATVVACW